MSQQQTVRFLFGQFVKNWFFQPCRNVELAALSRHRLGEVITLGFCFHQVVLKFPAFYPWSIHGIFNHSKWLVYLQCYFSSNFFVCKRNFTRSPVSQNNTAAAFWAKVCVCVCVKISKLHSLSFPTNTTLEKLTAGTQEMVFFLRQWFWQQHPKATLSCLHMTFIEILFAHLSA